LKIINGSQGYIQKYEDLKRKLYNCNANIYFNLKCLRNDLMPNYARIKIPSTSPTSKYIQQKTSTIRTKDEIKYLRIYTLKTTIKSATLTITHAFGQLME
jgi:hypothetical protein